MKRILVLMMSLVKYRHLLRSQKKKIKERKKEIKEYKEERKKYKE